MHLNSSRARNIERLEWALAALLLLWFGCTSMPHAWRALNADFPNYYITAHLLREHISTSRIYEWVWFQRQNDLLRTGQPFSAMQPLTPFSTLFMWPFASLAPLAAKHCWLILNAGMLLVTAWILRRIVALPWSRIALLIAASYPLQRNIFTGQLYVLLLFLIALALWMHLCSHHVAGGALIAIAIGLKLFPALYLLYFLRKRDWRALTGAVAGGLGVAAVSIAAFGWQLNRLYLLQILPRAMRGDGTDPYDLTSASFPALFHRLFVFEPTLNPHPVLHAAWLLAVLLPSVQLLLTTPLIVLIDPRSGDPQRTQIEWSAVLIACLTLSPMPASYHFVLLLLPVAVLAKRFIEQESHWQLAALVLLFLAIGSPHWPMNSVAPFYVPRLYAILALYVLTLWQLHPQEQRIHSLAMRNLPWIAALTSLAAISIVLALRSQPADSVYAGRIALAEPALSFGQPLATDNGIAFIAMQHTGYRSIEEGTPQDPARRPDELTHAALGASRWIEQVSTSPQIISNIPGTPAIANAEQPIVSTDGKWLAYVREDHGHGALWLHGLSVSEVDTRITPAEFDVLEASFAPDGVITFSAFNPAGIAALFVHNTDGHITQLLSEEARYPAVSPDGKWLVYSQLHGGSWNLRLRDRRTGTTVPLTDEPCNAIQPAWEPGSHTILFASDCGRAVGLTALYRRRIIP